MKFTVVISGTGRHPSDVRDFLRRTIREAWPHGSVEVHDEDCNYDENGVAIGEDATKKEPGVRS